jgi:predicted Fe-S protein YdhL (DUF1289 family)
LGKKNKIPSPCIDICKDIRGVCIGCGRTKKDEKAWKKAGSDEERLELLRQCLKKTARIGTQKLWLRQYKRKCLKKGAPWLIDELVCANADAAGQ